jgi:hypothetical protein
MPDGERKLEMRSATTRLSVTPRALPRLIRAGWALRKGFRGQDLDDESPEFVMLDERSSAILARAQDLAADDREDEEAVREVRTLAGRHEWSLRLAALGARQWNQHRESSIPNRAHRLLQAAIRGGPVEPLGVEEREQLDILDRFNQLTRAESWRMLTEREHRLLALETDARAGRFGTSGVIGMDMPREEELRIVRDRARGLKELQETLDPLVGPTSESDDVVLRSHVARERAHVCVMAVAPSI